MADSAGKRVRGKGGKDASPTEEETSGKETEHVAKGKGAVASASTSQAAASRPRTRVADDPSDPDDSDSSSEDERDDEEDHPEPTQPPMPPPESKSEKRSQPISSSSKLKEAKKKYKVREVKRDLAALTVKTGKKIENACAFTQWSKKLRSWQKSSNTFWIVNCSHRKDKYPSLFKTADEWLYIAIEGAIVDRVLLSLVQADSVGESGLKAIETLRQHFSLVGDEFTIDTLDQTLEQCRIQKGETVEEWLVRRHELEDLLATTYRRKTDDQLLTLLRKSIPDILKPVNTQLVISAPDFINNRPKYEQALKSYARMIGYPSGSKAEAPADGVLLDSVLAAGTTQINKSTNDIVESNKSNQFTAADLLAAAKFLANADKRNKPKSNDICEHCNKKGHIKPNCWKLYPEKIPDWVIQKKQERLKSSAAALAAKATEAINAAQKAARDHGLPTPTFSTIYRQDEPSTEGGKDTAKPNTPGVKWDVLCMAANSPETRYDSFTIYQFTHE